MALLGKFNVHVMTGLEVFTLSHAAFFLYIPAVETERKMIHFDVHSVFFVL
jgi:hypothetical protein